MTPKTQQGEALEAAVDRLISEAATLRHVYRSRLQPEKAEECFATAARDLRAAVRSALSAPSVPPVPDTLYGLVLEIVNRYALNGMIGESGVASAACDELRAALATRKPLDDPKLQQQFGDAIEGALAFGYQGTNKPPEGHWLWRFWNLGRASAPVQEGREPVAEVHSGQLRWLIPDDDPRHGVGNYPLYAGEQP